MTWPYVKETPTVENWTNGYGLTYSEDYTTVLWITLSDPNQIEVWDNDARAFTSNATLDPPTITPSFPNFFGLTSDDTLYAVVSGNRLAFWDNLGATAGEIINTSPTYDPIQGDGVLSFGTSVRTLAYSTGMESYAWTHGTVPPGDLTVISTVGQVKGYIAKDGGGFYTCSVNGTLSANELLIDDETVTVSGTQGGTSGVVYGFDAGDAVIVAFGHGSGQRICRIDKATWTETHAIDEGATYEIPWAMQWTPPGSASFFIRNTKYNSADLTVLATYPFTNWGFSAIQIERCVKDPLTDALFVSFTDGDIGWLEFPTIRRVHGHIRYGAER